ncbi:AAA family ATPase [Hoeflea sp.]|uniref:AAA family ATPase n=1 Tax=Hoeflea sp. TaxID=1940281 RepID=UPI003B01D638
MFTSRLVLISGCSGGGKSTLLHALGKRGYGIVEEPGRRIVAEEMARGGTALPWIDMTAFARRAVDLSRLDLRKSRDQDRLVFFDRGLIDAAVALEHSGGESLDNTLNGARPYDSVVFMAPPWPEIHVKDNERRHDFDEATAEYHRLETAFDSLGYDVHLLPKVTVDERVTFVLAALGRS